jgi:hypothetical protein
VYNFQKRAPLAQLDRASGYEPEGREFESLRAHHLSQLKTKKLRATSDFETALLLVQFPGTMADYGGFTGLAPSPA